jgi:hypothetical protein
MKKQLPILVALLLVMGGTWFVVTHKQPTSMLPQKTVATQKPVLLGSFVKKRSCARPPAFLRQLHIAQPVVIDLSQKQFTGLSLLYGKGFKKVLHPASWERYGNLGTYSVDEKGDIFLAPIPYISIKEKTFMWQSNLYRLDSHTGALTLWKHLDDVKPSASNPYGITAVVYDCSNHTLWVSAIDESDYQSERGVLYHIDVESKKVLQKVSGKDILSLQILETQKGKFLLAGSARDDKLYAYTMRKEGSVVPHARVLLSLGDANSHIRKIKIGKKNHLRLESIPFSYTLITQTAEVDRSYYDAIWKEKRAKWRLLKVKE